jgi:hypothetical protein
MPGTADTESARMTIFPFTAPARWLAGLSLALALPAGAAEFRDPGRVGRIVDLQGDVALYDPEFNEWTEAVRNRPLVAGDRLVLQRSARAELRVGDTVLLLGQGADVAIDALDDDRLRLTLLDGSLALRLDSRDAAESTEVRTAAALLRPQRAGRYRLDQDGESTFAAVWRGALEVSGHGHLLLVGAGERHEIWRDERRGGARSREARMPQDRFAAWADDRFDEEDAREARHDRWRHAPPGIPGLDDLERHGRWDHHPEYGSVWVPVGVPAGWAPFTDGRWVWMRPWGWTWVDAQPWGFAPSHYGRWVQWGGRWAWWPGPRHVRPVFSPAVVAWVGGSGVSVGVTVGLQPPVAWVPLQPWQPYVPIVAPRPPRPHPDLRPPPRRLPPPSEPISRTPQGPAAGGGQTVGTGRPLPPGSVTYGTDGLPQQVQVAPAARPPSPPAPPAVAPLPPPAAARPAMPPAPAVSPQPPAVRAPLPPQRPGPRDEAAPRPAPFSAAPRAEPARIAPAPAPAPAPSPAPAREPRGTERVK